MRDVSGATALTLEPTGSGDVVEQLNKAATHVGLAWPVTIAAFILGAIHLPYSALCTVLLAPLCVWLFLHDQAKRTVVLFYDIHDDPAEWFDSLVTSWTLLSCSQKLSRVIQRGRVQTTYQYKVNSGASSLFDSEYVSAATHGPKHLSTNILVPSLISRSSCLYFLPDRLLVQEGKRYSDVGYQHLTVFSNQKRTIEDGGCVPTDAQRVGETWRYVNVDGGPDRRFNNNAKLPIMLYGILDLVSQQGLSWQLQISRADAAPTIASVVAKARTIAEDNHQRRYIAAVNDGYTAYAMVSPASDGTRQWWVAFSVDDHGRVIDHGVLRLDTEAEALDLMRRGDWLGTAFVEIVDS